MHLQFSVVPNFYKYLALTHNRVKAKLFIFGHQFIREITGRTWREVLGHALLFLWAKVLDFWLKKDYKDSKWIKQGGSEGFFRYIVKFSSSQMTTPDILHISVTFIIFLRFLPDYLARIENNNRPQPAVKVGVILNHFSKSEWLFCNVHNFGRIWLNSWPSFWSQFLPSWRRGISSLLAKQL